jgi:hypothetical protein
LRGQALSDDETLRLIDAKFVPVWIDTTRSGIPDGPAFRDLKEWFDRTTSSFATGWIATSFYLGSVVLTPDGTERLNESTLPWPWTWKEAKAKDYLEMLRGSLQRRSKSSDPPP